MAVITGGVQNTAKEIFLELDKAIKKTNAGIGGTSKLEKIEKSEILTPY